jgi:exopolysaccharide biosynthesis polyprenyl glycosylphosphotransferase
LSGAVLAVEVEPFHIANPYIETPPVELSSPARGGLSRVPLDDKGRYTPPSIRLGLQRRASANLNRHLLRDVRRFVVLLIADLGSFYVMRALLRAIRDDAVLGSWLGSIFSETLPKGILNGWQFAFALIVGLLVTGNYGPGDQRRDPRRLFLACALATALPLWMTLWTRGFDVVAVEYLLIVVLAWTGLLAQRLLLDRTVARFAPARSGTIPTLFVGPAEHCRIATQGPAFTVGSEHRIVGFVDTHIPPAPDALGHIVDFANVVHDTACETVVMCGYLPDSRFHDIVDAALGAGCQVLSVPRAIDIAGVKPLFVWRRGERLIELTAPSLKGSQLALKRVTDVLGAVAGLIIAAPLMALIALAIKFDSPGPVFFGQDRAGLGGRRFRILKFRTMHNGAAGELQAVAHLNHSGDPRLFKIRHDPRVTPLGTWLRRWSLDELPQLFNVLRGDMTLVGPRPFFGEDLKSYEDRHFRRLGAKPGITGLWQVRGRSLITDFEEVVKLDRQYIEQWSLWMDVQILLLTLPAVIRRQGAF